ncbi:MAG: DUF1015 family protein [Sporomusaceae bacterium]|jgi:uncharacterized protein (DUF1015 family)|nr:DUF1015 family protein [Sporomusaceae bacterium]
MAIVKPFQAYRPQGDLAQSVSALPYDVMDSDEAREITKNNPHSFLRVTKAEVDLAPETDTHSPAVYQKAAATLNEFIQKEILRQDPQPCFYIYRQQMGAHVQVGLVAAVSVDEYEQNIIKKHEFTRPDKEQDRVDHILATSAQTGSVFLTYRENQKITAMLEAQTQNPVCDFTSADGVAHTLYVVADSAAIEAISAAFAAVPALYIADGHHRSAAAMRVRQALAQKNPSHTGKEAYNFFQAVIFPHTMMQIMDYNRVVRDLNNYTPAEFLAKVAEKFTVTEIKDSQIKPAQLHNFSMYLEGTWYSLTAKAETFRGKSTLEALDVSILQTNLLDPVLGIKDQRTDQRINFIGGIRGLKELEKLVESGKYQVAFALFPTSIEELMAISDTGEVMPPKSTWFEPKLRDGLVLHKFS